MAKIDTEKFSEYVEKKLITCRPHKNGELFIYNYTPMVQYSKLWDEVTLQSRGLIVDKYGNIIARPFSKFFNYGEYQGEIPNIGYTVTEKMDGSLGIMYWAGDRWAIATRGSFESDQAKYGTALLHDYIKRHGQEWIKPEWTYLFEIIYPENRIVVDYGSRAELVLLAIINTETGEEVPLMSTIYRPTVTLVGHSLNLESLADMNKPNQEGYVVTFENGLRLKVKFEEYVRLHRILTNISSKSIWDLLRNDQTLEDIIDNVPDEFYDWVMKTYGDLLEKYHKLNDEVIEAVKTIPEGVSRREQAEYILANYKDISGMVFNRFDGKPYEDQLWKNIKPTYEIPFRKDIDA